MQNIITDIKKILSDRLYLAATAFAMVLGYGFEITHFSMGIDDISMEMYLEKGLLPETGRWVLFLINKLVPVSDFAPFFSEVIGAVLLYLAAAVFCVLLKHISGDNLPRAAYIVFTCFFVSNPLFSENDIYYLHNAADLGWLFTALALVLTYDLISSGKKKPLDILKTSLPIVLLVWTASGCYESFVFVYLTCILLILFMNGAVTASKVSFLKVVTSSIYGGIVCFASLICRSIICSIIPVVFGLKDVTSSYVTYRGAFSAIKAVLFSGNFDKLKELIRFLVLRYHLNGLIYLPITLYVLALIVLLVACIAQTVRTKSIGYLFIWLGAELLPLFQAIILGYIFPMRSAQMIPVTVAFMMAFVVYAVCNIKKYGKPVRLAAGVILALLIVNCCSRLNYNFHLDVMKYENDKEVFRDIAEDVYAQAGAAYGSNVTVYFAGGQPVPLAFRNGFYVSTSDPRFKAICTLLKPVDSSAYSAYSYVSDDRYFFDGEMIFPLFMWGKEAFNGTNDELIRFMNMHGTGLSTIHDPDEISRAKSEAESMPCWPAEGSIVQKDGYILVKI